MENLKEVYLREPYIKDGRTWYEAHFPSLMDLYMYLKSKPSINRKVFTERGSIHNDSDFAGENLTKAIEYLKGGYETGYREFLETARELDSKIEYKRMKPAFERSVVGSRIHIPSAVAGSPKFMLRPVYEDEKKIYNLYFNLCYPGYTSEVAIRNRGLIALFVMRLLMKNGHYVNLKSFELSTEENEVAFINIMMKYITSRLNTDDAYYVFTAKEFGRRVLFYCLETMAIKVPYWGSDYGNACGIEEARELLELKKDDIYFGNPSEMDIDENLYRSLDRVLQQFELDNLLKRKIK